MEIEIPTQDGLQPQGQKLNQTPLDQPLPKPKPEIKITNPAIISQMPGPMPLNLGAASEVDAWVKLRVPAQNSVQQEFVELSSDHRHYRIDQIDLIRPTVYQGVAAIIFRYQDRTSGQVQVVIIKLDRRDDAIPLARAIAWRRIQVFPYGQFIQGKDADLTTSPPFNPAQCVDYYFRQQWLTDASTKLAADRAAIAQPLADAERKNSEHTSRITWLESQRTAAENAQAKAEADYAREHGRAIILNRLAYAFAGIIIIIIIIIFFA